jgi:exopolysaccharide biosynthesis polyprenyl glycosylphosphotransferase
MYISKKKVLLFAGDLFLIIVSFHVCFVFLYGEYVSVLYTYTVASALSLFVFSFVFYMADIYNREREVFSLDYMVKLAVALLVVYMLIAVAFYFSRTWKYQREVIAVNFFSVFPLMLGWRYIFHKLFIDKKAPSKILVVGAGSACRSLYQVLDGNSEYVIEGIIDDDTRKAGMVIGSITVFGNSDQLLARIEDKGIEEVVIAITHGGTSSKLLRIIMDAKFNGLMIWDMPTFYEKITGKIPILHISDSWLGYSDFYGIRRNVYNTKIKMVMEKVIAICGLALSIPLSLITMMAIKIDSRGPVFFTQTRVGENARIFDVFKFRTMKCIEKNDDNTIPSHNYRNITRVGRILRRFRIDEIPQLWNVIRGDMSIIGPRSLMKEEVDGYLSKVPYFYLRHSIRPGVTGWAQVNYKHGNQVEDAIEKLQYDLYYIKNLSFIIDMHILLKTMKVVFFGRGAR